MLLSFKPVSHNHDFYCRLWQDHFRIEFVKSISKIPLIQIWKSIFLIRTTIIYCSGSAKIRSFLGKYIPIVPFSLLLYIFRTVKNDRLCPHSIKILQNVIQQSSYSNHAVNRRWRKISFRQLSFYSGWSALKTALYM